MWEVGQFVEILCWDDSVLIAKIVAASTDEYLVQYEDGELDVYPRSVVEPPMTTPCGKKIDAPEIVRSLGFLN